MKVFPTRSFALPLILFDLLMGLVGRLPQKLQQVQKLGAIVKDKAKKQSTKYKKHD